MLKKTVLGYDEITIKSRSRDVYMPWDSKKKRRDSMGFQGKKRQIPWDSNRKKKGFQIWILGFHFRFFFGIPKYM